MEDHPIGNGYGHAKTCAIYAKPTDPGDLPVCSCRPKLAKSEDASRLVAMLQTSSVHLKLLMMMQSAIDHGYLRCPKCKSEPAAQ